MMRKKKHALFAFHGHRLDKLRNYQYNILAIGVWRSLVSRLVRVQEASGSNPDTPTKNVGIAKAIPTFFIVVRDSKRAAVTL